MRCADCRFWLETDEDVGACRRHAPRPIIVDGKPRALVEADGLTYWPRTITGDWCGEFEEADS